MKTFFKHTTFLFILSAIFAISVVSCKKEEKEIVTAFTVVVTGTYQYNGAAHEPSGASVIVKANDKTLYENTDYTLSYSENIYAGEAAVTATGKGRHSESSTGEGNFTIHKRPVTVKADDSEKSIFIADDPPLTYTTKPLLFGDDQLAGMLTREKGVKVGKYLIGQGTLNGGDNYEITDFNGGEFEIYVFRGDGESEATAYEIGAAEQLAGLAGFVNAGNTAYNDKYYKLTADIDLNVAPYNVGEGWAPIGVFNGYRFKGNFNGDYHRVNGLYININSGYADVGLFGAIEGGSVKNLGVVNADIKGYYETGGVVAAWLKGGGISNCYTTGSISGIWNIGGVAGGVAGVIEYITNCYSSATVSGVSCVGGVAGLVQHDGIIANCYSTGAISGEVYVGGVVGNVSSERNVSNCYSTGTIRGNRNVGGVVGYIFASGVSCCAALNPNVEGEIRVGRIVGGSMYEMTYSNNFAYSGMYVNGVVVTNGTADNNNGADLDKSAAILQATYENLLGWKFGNNDDNPWIMGAGDYKLPVLYWQTETPKEMPEHLK